MLVSILALCFMIRIKLECGAKLFDSLVILIVLNVECCLFGGWVQFVLTVYLIANLNRMNFTFINSALVPYVP